MLIRFDQFGLFILMIVDENNGSFSVSKFCSPWSQERFNRSEGFPFIMAENASSVETNPWSTTQVLLVTPVVAVALLGNGAILYLFVRRKIQHTIPNILIVNLAVVDLLNTVINMPLFIGWNIFRSKVFHGRLISFTIISLHHEYTSHSLVQSIIH